MTINELLTLLNSNNNKNYYIFDSGKKGKHIKMFFIAKEKTPLNNIFYTVLVIDDCIQCIFDYRKLLFIAEGFKDKDNLRIKCGKNRVSTRYINLFIKNTLKHYLGSNIKLIAIPFIDYCYNKDPNKLIEMI